MGEKIKDLIYDLSDTLITLIMIVLIVGVVSWKISDSMTYPSAISKAQPPIVSEQSPPAGSESEPTPENAGTQNPGENPSETAGSPVQMPSNTLPGSATAAPQGQKVTLVIKSGSTGYDIAKLIVEKGLVKDTQTFIQRVEALKLGSKLKAGTFEVTAGTSLDDLIRIITS